MSVVVPFPGQRATARGNQHNRVSQRSTGAHPARAGSVISWVRPASCDCCGRPTLAGRSGLEHVTLCGQSSPPSIA